MDKRASKFFFYCWCLAACGALLAQTGRAQTTGKSYEIKDPPKRAANAPTAQSPVTFTDISAASGLNFKHAASATTQKYLPEAMGAGVALFDYDNDGRLDIYLTNGAQLADPMPAGAQPDKRAPQYWNRLFHQKADGTFTDVTKQAGVQGVGYDFGAAAGDYDNDGLTDLYVTSYGGNKLYRNRGDGTFADVTAQTKTGAGGWSTSAAWLDYDKDGRLDLFVARYMVWDFVKGALFCGSTQHRAYCHPDNFPAISNVLYRQQPDGTFADVSRTTKIADYPSKGLGVACADFNNDGWTDIVVANDSVRQSLFLNQGDGTFAETAELAGVGYDENGKTFAGMGIDAADYDNNGGPDIFITALSNETYPLYQNNGDDTFDYATNRTGLSLITLLNAGWGAKFIDADNDGRRDIFVAQGHVLDTIEQTSSYLKYKQTPLLLRNIGAGFVNVSPTAGAAFAQPLAARGAAFGDLDNDGDTDVVIGVLNAAPVLLRNEGAKNHWLGVSLLGDKSNRQGLGARLTVTESDGRKQIFDVSGAGSYLASNDPRVLIGLGAEGTVVEIAIRWPGGRVQKILKPNIDRYLMVKESDK